MNLNEFKDFFEKECENNNIDIGEYRIENFYNYMNGIIEWNKNINLTAINDKKEFIVKHFIDSLTINKYMSEKFNLIDIGTGAGFPGIPLKIANENLKVTLLDSINKKLNVIKEVTKNFEFKNLEILHGRAEELAKKKEYREKFDIATTRAVSNLNTIVEYMLPFLKIGGIAICMKGPNCEEELKNAQKAIEMLGGRIDNIENLIIDGELERNNIIIKKVKLTPSKYPRSQGKPVKDPII